MEHKGREFARPSLNNLENARLPYGLEIGGLRILVEWTHEAAHWVSSQINTAFEKESDARVKRAVEAVSGQLAWEREENERLVKMLADQAVDHEKSIRAAVAKAKEEEREEACRAVCEYCQGGVRLMPNMTHHFARLGEGNSMVYCIASAIRSLPISRQEKP